jgi:hypothetical protein
MKSLSLLVKGVTSQNGFVPSPLGPTRIHISGLDKVSLSTCTSQLCHVRIRLSSSGGPETVLGGDASTRFIAAYQDEAMAALKDSDEQVILPKNTAARGRDNYSLYGVLRTKPGRADSPPTMCMSCSDKIAKWCALGVQGALLTRFLPEPISIYEIIIGEVEASERSMVKHDCERAFHGRLRYGWCFKAVTLPLTYLEKLAIVLPQVFQ